MCLIGRRGSETQGAFNNWEQLVTQDRFYGPSNCSATIQLGDYAAQVTGNYDITASDFTFNGYTVGRNLWVRVLSIGYDDPGE